MADGGDDEGGGREPDADEPDDPDAADEGTDRDDRAPLADLRDRVRDRRAERDAESGFDDVDEPEVASGDEDLFEQQDVEPIDEEAVWESLSDDEADEDEGPVTTPQIGDGSAERVRDDPPEHLVNKRSYCQRCPHFGDPPHVRCTNGGTEIVAVEDSDHFRVRACPVVANEERTRARERADRRERDG